ncbi:MAG TPA: PD-(D/E)XK nuclease family protein, partial [Polyangiales bacterium]|nr:PD-(D/E)XK nuclease family protein [Polyangiales bacterium]
MEPVGVALDPRDRARRSELQRLMSAYEPALEALCGLLRAVISGESLGALWAQLSDFARSHLKLPHATPPVIALLDGMCSRFVGDGAHAPSGQAALAWLEDTLCESVAMVGRFGEPAVYLGTLGGVRGLSFAAVRVMGLVEGAVPSATREDPVLPDDARRALSSLLPTAALRAHRQVASFDDAVRAARKELALSAPRVSADGTVRQPAAVLLDVVRALEGSHHALEHKLADAAAVGRERERKLRELCPVSAAAILARVARRDRASLRADENPALSLAAMRAIRDRKDFGPQDGLLAGAVPFEKTAGLSAERPISASRLEKLLSCPHRFLYESVLGFRGPTWPLAAHSINVMYFGSWLHAIAEEFWAQHGAAVGARVGSSELHRTALEELALERFEALRASYPFANDAAADATRAELCDQLSKLFSLDWDHGDPKT